MDAGEQSSTKTLSWKSCKADPYPSDPLLTPASGALAGAPMPKPGKLMSTVAKTGNRTAAVKAKRGATTDRIGSPFAADGATLTLKHSPKGVDAATPGDGRGESQRGLPKGWQSQHAGQEFDAEPVSSSKLRTTRVSRPLLLQHQQGCSVTVADSCLCSIL